jgi:hypothetical protein
VRPQEIGGWAPTTAFSEPLFRARKERNEVGNRLAQTPRTYTDLLDQLQEQQGFLRKSCTLYDAGDPTEAKRLAVALRILVHDGRGKSLLGQLGMLDQPLLAFSVPWEPLNVVAHTGLVGMAGATSDQWTPLLDFGRRPLPFPEWWSEVVVCDDHRETLTRRDLVMTMADQDGGAHVDPALEVKYERMSRQNSTGWKLFGNAGEKPMRGLHTASVRQIAHEILRTLRDQDYSPAQPPGAGVHVFGVEVYDDPPADIKALMQAHEWARTTGRNDPCPCRNGRKFKKCHGKGL